MFSTSVKKFNFFKDQSDSVQQISGSKMKIFEADTGVTGIRKSMMICFHIGDNYVHTQGLFAL